MYTALTIAGSDSSGGAGIQADIKTMTANRVYAMSAITALTAQNTTGVTDIMEVTPKFLAEQLDSIFTDIHPDAIKTGMVSSSELIETIAEKLTEYHAKNIVVDPVMVATSGARLINEEAISTLKSKLLPLATVINTYCTEPMDLSSPSIVRDPSKCILCGLCVRTCAEIQNIGAVDFSGRGKKAHISADFGKTLKDTDCVGCGQCAAVCPTGAITIRNETEKFWSMLQDQTRKVVVQYAPSVRAGMAERFGLPANEPCTGKLVAALRRLGADVVYDTNLTADLTIMEESAEFLEKVKTGAKLPMFTSCCPGWIHPANVISGLSDGTATITASVTDAAGNTGSGTHNVTVDTGLPSVITFIIYISHTDKRQEKVDKRGKIAGCT